MKHAKLESQYLKWCLMDHLFIHLSRVWKMEVKIVIEMFETASCVCLSSQIMAGFPARKRSGHNSS